MYKKLANFKFIKFILIIIQNARIINLPILFSKSLEIRKSSMFEDCKVSLLLVLSMKVDI